jgi:hypothetical protein
MPSDDTEIQKFVLKYLGEAPDEVGGSEIKYYIKSDTGSSSGTQVF